MPEREPDPLYQHSFNIIPFPTQHHVHGNDLVAPLASHHPIVNESLLDSSGTIGAYSTSHGERFYAYNKNHLTLFSDVSTLHKDREVIPVELCLSAGYLTSNGMESGMLDAPNRSAPQITTRTTPVYVLTYSELRSNNFSMQVPVCIEKVIPIHMDTTHTNTTQEDDEKYADDMVFVLKLSIQGKSPVGFPSYCVLSPTHGIVKTPIDFLRKDQHICDGYALIRDSFVTNDTLPDDSYSFALISATQSARPDEILVHYHRFTLQSSSGQWSITNQNYSHVFYHPIQSDQSRHDVQPTTLSTTMVSTSWNSVPSEQYHPIAVYCIEYNAVPFIIVVDQKVSSTSKDSTLQNNLDDRPSIQTLANSYQIHLYSPLYGTITTSFMPVVSKALLEAYPTIPMSQTNHDEIKSELNRHYYYRPLTSFESDITLKCVKILVQQQQHQGQLFSILLLNSVTFKLEDQTIHDTVGTLVSFTHVPYELFHQYHQQRSQHLKGASSTPIIPVITTPVTHSEKDSYLFTLPATMASAAPPVLTFYALSHAACSQITSFHASLVPTYLTSKNRDPSIILGCTSPSPLGLQPPSVGRDATTVTAQERHRTPTTTASARSVLKNPVVVADATSSTNTKATTTPHAYNPSVLVRQYAQGIVQLPNDLTELVHTSLSVPWCQHIFAQTLTFGVHTPAGSTWEFPAPQDVCRRTLASIIARTHPRTLALYLYWNGLISPIQIYPICFRYDQLQHFDDLPDYDTVVNNVVNIFSRKGDHQLCRESALGISAILGLEPIANFSQTPTDFSFELTSTHKHRVLYYSLQSVPVNHLFDYVTRSIRYLPSSFTAVQAYCTFRISLRLNELRNISNTIYKMTNNHLSSILPTSSAIELLDVDWLTTSTQQQNEITPISIIRKRQQLLSHQHQQCHLNVLHKYLVNHLEEYRQVLRIIKYLSQLQHSNDSIRFWSLSASIQHTEARKQQQQQSSSSRGYNTTIEPTYELLAILSIYLHAIMTQTSLLLAITSTLIASHPSTKAATTLTTLLLPIQTAASIHFGVAGESILVAHTAWNTMASAYTKQLLMATDTVEQQDTPESKPRRKGSSRRTVALAAPTLLSQTILQHFQPQRSDGTSTAPQSVVERITAVHRDNTSSSNPDQEYGIHTLLTAVLSQNRDYARLNEDYLDRLPSQEVTPSADTTLPHEYMLRPYETTSLLHDSTPTPTLQSTASTPPRHVFQTSTIRATQLYHELQTLVLLIWHYPMLDVEEVIHHLGPYLALSRASIQLIYGLVKIDYCGFLLHQALGAASASTESAEGIEQPPSALDTELHIAKILVHAMESIHIADAIYGESDADDVVLHKLFSTIPCVLLTQLLTLVHTAYPCNYRSMASTKRVGHSLFSRIASLVLLYLPFVNGIVLHQLDAMVAANTLWTLSPTVIHSCIHAFMLDGRVHHAMVIANHPSISPSHDGFQSRLYGTIIMHCLARKDLALQLHDTEMLSHYWTPSFTSIYLAYMTATRYPSSALAASHESEMDDDHHPFHVDLDTIVYRLSQWYSSLASTLPSKITRNQYSSTAMLLAAATSSPTQLTNTFTRPVRGNGPPLASRLDHLIGFLISTYPALLQQSPFSHRSYLSTVYNALLPVLQAFYGLQKPSVDVTEKTAGRMSPEPVTEVQQQQLHFPLQSRQNSTQSLFRTQLNMAPWLQRSPVIMAPQRVALLTTDSSGTTAQSETKQASTIIHRDVWDAFTRHCRDYGCDTRSHTSSSFTASQLYTELHNVLLHLFDLDSDHTLSFNLQDSPSTTITPDTSLNLSRSSSSPIPSMISSNAFGIPIDIDLYESFTETAHTYIARLSEDQADPVITITPIITETTPFGPTYLIDKLFGTLRKELETLIETLKVREVMTMMKTPQYYLCCYVADDRSGFSQLVEQSAPLYSGSSSSMSQSGTAPPTTTSIKYNKFPMPYLLHANTGLYDATMSDDEADNEEIDMDEVGGDGDITPPLNPLPDFPDGPSTPVKLPSKQPSVLDTPIYKMRSKPITRIARTAQFSSPSPRISVIVDETNNDVLIISPNPSDGGSLFSLDSDHDHDQSSHDGESRDDENGSAHTLLEGLSFNLHDHSDDSDVSSPGDDGPDDLIFPEIESSHDDDDDDDNDDDDEMGDHDHLDVDNKDDDDDEEDLETDLPTILSWSSQGEEDEDDIIYGEGETDHILQHLLQYGLGEGEYHEEEGDDDDIDMDELFSHDIFHFEGDLDGDETEGDDGHDEESTSHDGPPATTQNNHSLISWPSFEDESTEGHTDKDDDFDTTTTSLNSSTQDFLFEDDSDGDVQNNLKELNDSHHDSDDEEKDVHGMSPLDGSHTLTNASDDEDEGETLDNSGILSILNTSLSRLSGLFTPAQHDTSSSGTTSGDDEHLDHMKTDNDEDEDQDDDGDVSRDDDIEGHSSTPDDQEEAEPSQDPESEEKDHQDSDENEDDDSLQTILHTPDDQIQTEVQATDDQDDDDNDGDDNTTTQTSIVDDDEATIALKKIESPINKSLVRRGTYISTAFLDLFDSDDDDDKKMDSHQQDDDNDDDDSDDHDDDDGESDNDEHDEEQSSEEHDSIPHVEPQRPNIPPLDKDDDLTAHPQVTHSANTPKRSRPRTFASPQQQSMPVGSPLSPSDSLRSPLPPAKRKRPSLIIDQHEIDFTEAYVRLPTQTALSPRQPPPSQPPLQSPSWVASPVVAPREPSPPVTRRITRSRAKKQDVDDTPLFSPIRTRRSSQRTQLPSPVKKPASRRALPPVVEEEHDDDDDEDSQENLMDEEAPRSPSPPKTRGTRARTRAPATGTTTRKKATGTNTSNPPKRPLSTRSRGRRTAAAGTDHEDDTDDDDQSQPSSPPIFVDLTDDMSTVEDDDDDDEDDRQQPSPPATRRSSRLARKTTPVVSPPVTRTRSSARSRSSSSTAAAASTRSRRSRQKTTSESDDELGPSGSLQTIQEEGSDMDDLDHDQEEEVKKPSRKPSRSTAKPAATRRSTVKKPQTEPDPPPSPPAGLRRSSRLRSAR